MLSKLKNKLTNILSFDLSIEEINEVKLRIKKNNTNKLRYMSIIVFLIFLCLFLSTFLSSDIDDLIHFRIIARYIYFTVALIALFIFIFSIKYLPQHLQYTFITWYILLSVLFAFAIWVGILAQPHYPGVSFFVFLFALPLLIVDKTFRMTSYLLLICIIYLILSYSIKTTEVFLLDLGNCLTFLFMSIGISFHVRFICMKEVINEIKLEEQRDIDSLSLLFNKACFERKIKFMPKNKGILLIIDIDNFKIFNDQYGHIYGDSIIREVGKAIKEVFHTDCLAGRFGGDEFVVYVNNIDDLKEIEKRFAVLSHQLKIYTSTPQNVNNISLSCGGAMYPSEATDYLSLLEIADKRLYTVKNNGKNNILLK